MPFFNMAFLYVGVLVLLILPFSCIDCKSEHCEVEFCITSVFGVLLTQDAIIRANAI